MLGAAYDREPRSDRSALSKGRLNPCAEALGTPSVATMFNDLSSPLALLQTRRSGKPRDLIAPGPDDAQLRQILEVALRTPDHGKLAPWRFVIVPQDRRAALADVLETAYRAEKPDAGRLEIEAMHQFAHQAPTLVVALSTPVAGSKIPVWEQELSAGAAIMNLLHATHALGFAGGWLTGWPSFNDDVRAAFGKDGEKIAGFVFIGTSGKPQEERPRPKYDAIVSTWDR
jgi:nitroreductase